MAVELYIGTLEQLKNWRVETTLYVVLSDSTGTGSCGL